MLLWYDQNVAAGDGKEVEEREGPVVLVDHVGLGAARHDLAEDATIAAPVAFGHRRAIDARER